MSILQQVLADQTEGKPFPQLPSETRIQPGVCRAGATLKPIHKIDGGVPRDSVGEVEV